MRAYRKSVDGLAEKATYKQIILNFWRTKTWHFSTAQ